MPMTDAQETSKLIRMFLERVSVTLTNMKPGILKKIGKFTEFNNASSEDNDGISKHMQ